ncbi:MAG: hypothetical protein JOZ49_13860 [Mycolicibacterium sp.]|nr:hypothetical protein [Mycolicibacterium sp.]
MNASSPAPCRIGSLREGGEKFAQTTIGGKCLPWLGAFWVRAADVIRLAPPLVINEAQLNEFLTALPDVLDTAAG